MSVDFLLFSASSIFSSAKRGARESMTFVLFQRHLPEVVTSCDLKEFFFDKLNLVGDIQK